MLFGELEYCMPLKPVLGVFLVLHLSLLPMNSLNQTKTAVFTVPLHLLLPGDHITSIYLYFNFILKTETSNNDVIKFVTLFSDDPGIHVCVLETV